MLQALYRHVVFRVERCALRVLPVEWLFSPHMFVLSSAFDMHDHCWDRTHCCMKDLKFGNEIDLTNIRRMLNPLILIISRIGSVAVGVEGRK